MLAVDRALCHMHGAERDNTRVSFFAKRAVQAALVHYRKAETLHDCE